MTIQKTRFKELGYRQDGRALWRIVDAETGANVGPQYATKSELLADLARYAQQWGCTNA